MEHPSKPSFYKGLVLLSFLVLITFGVWHTLLTASTKELQVSVLDIGQGDAIYIKAPNGAELVIDGGPNQSLFTVLGEEMSPFDKSIDLIVVTNPDKDHYAGFLSLLDSYTVGRVLISGTKSSTPTYHAFEEKVKEKEIETLIARSGMQFVIDEEQNIILEILYPDHDVSGASSNEGSIVAKLSYGTTCILLQGDATASVERQILAKQLAENLRCQILKVGHHGSRTSTSESYLKAVAPKLALISLGEDNRYGHPHEEVLTILKAHNVVSLRTDIEGTITFFSDGNEWRRK